MVTLMVGLCGKTYSFYNDPASYVPIEVLSTGKINEHPNVKWSSHAVLLQDSIMSKKEKKRLKKLEKKKMYKDLKFKIGDGVTVTTGPMKEMYGTVIYYDTKMKYLIRFTGTQQMFFAEEEIKLWDK